MFHKIKTSLVKADGSINGRVVAPLAGLLIVAVQEFAACFGIHLKGDMGQVQNLVNTMLAMFGILGVVSDPTPVDVVKKDAKKRA